MSAYCLHLPVPPSDVLMNWGFAKASAKVWFLCKPKMSLAEACSNFRLVLFVYKCHMQDATLVAVVGAASCMEGSFAIA